MLTALGARFLDASGAPVPRGARGLADIAVVDVTGLRAAPEVRVLTDVTNPLVGQRGAAAVFGPQKGLRDAVDIARVDEALERLATLLGLDPAQEGTGAAGGTGAALVAWGGVLAPGAAEVSELIRLPAAIAATWGFMLPAGTGPNAIAWGTGHIAMGRMIRAGLLLDIAGVFLIVAVVWMIAPLVV